MFMGVLLECLSVHHAPAVSVVARRGHWIPETGVYSCQLPSGCWGSNLWKAISTLNHGAILQPPDWISVTRRGAANDFHLQCVVTEKACSVFHEAMLSSVEQ